MVKTTLQTDVLIIGGGAAGFRAAIEVKKKDLKTIIACKGPLARCGATPMAAADFTLDGKSLSELNFTGAPNDSQQKFFSDIVHQGFYLNNQLLVEQYVQSAPDRLKELIDWGIHIYFSEERAIFTTGTGLMKTLLKKANYLGVDMLEDTMVMGLVIQEGEVAGALALDIRSGEFIVIKTKAIVIATGGWHKAFWPNTGMRDLSGDGIALAHRAGAFIGNMEFITFICNAIFSPQIWLGSIATYLTSLLCGGQLTNCKGELFLNKYDPYVVKKGTTTEWNKSLVSFATMREVRDGKGSPHGGVYYVRGNVSWEEFEEKAKMLFPRWKYKAIDFSELARMLKNNEPIEVGPAVEYFEGGIVINEHLATNVPGLYGAGECTLGVFGANRVASAITEVIVHGAVAGKHAAEYAKHFKGRPIDYKVLNEHKEIALQPLLRKEGINPAHLRRQVQEKAHKCLGPIRTQDELVYFIDFLEDVKHKKLPLLATTSKSRLYNKEWVDALELRNMVLLLEAASRSALFRTESRGVHFREDYPETDNDNWLYESIVKPADEEFKIAKLPVTVTRIPLPRGTFPYLEMIKKMMEQHSDIGGHH